MGLILPAQNIFFKKCNVIAFLFFISQNAKKFGLLYNKTMENKMKYVFCKIQTKNC